MGLKRFGRLILAYLAATLSVVPVAAVGADVARRWGVDLTAWAIGAPLWLLVIGVPSMGWAAANLAKTLGHKSAPMVRVGGWRAIPIGGVNLADRVTSVVGIRNPGRSAGSLAIADDLSFVSGRFVFPEADMLLILRKAWSRQRAGRHPFTRGYWLSSDFFAGDRDKYDAAMEVLDAAGLIIGRGPGASGRLVAPPAACISGLKHRL